MIWPASWIPDEEDLDAESEDEPDQQFAGQGQQVVGQGDQRRDRWGGLDRQDQQAEGEGQQAREPASVPRCRQRSAPSSPGRLPGPGQA